MREEILRELKELAESDYKEFNSSLIPGVDKDKTLGVRVPLVRKTAKKAARKDWEKLLSELENCPQEAGGVGGTALYYEEVMLQGMVIGAAKMDAERRLSYIERFIPRIDNWAICDMVCNTLTCFQKDAPEGFHYLLDLLQQDNPWIIRFVLIMFLSHYLQDDYIDKVLEASASVTNDHYYVRMGNAWLLSVAFVKYRDKTVNLLKSSRLDDWTYHKTLQKIMESNRVDQVTKEWISTMKALR